MSTMKLTWGGGGGLKKNLCDHFPVSAFFKKQLEHLSVSLLTGQHEGRYSILKKEDENRQEK